MSVRVQNRDPEALVHVQDNAIFVARRVPDVPKFKLAALIRAGSLQDIVPGTAHFFEHLPFNSTVHFKNDELANFFEQRGGYVNAFTGDDTTVYHGEVTKDHFLDGIRGIAELVRFPVFEETRIRDEAQTIVTEWAKGAMTQSRQRYFAARQAVLGDKDPHWVIGDPSSIQSIRLQDINGFYQRHYVSDNLIVYMQGDVDPQRLLEEGVQQFTLPRGLRTALPSPYPFVPSTKKISIPNVPATHATILFPSETLEAEPSIIQTAALAREMIATGRLYKEARINKRLVYSIEPNIIRANVWGFSSIEFDAFPDRVPRASELVMRQLNGMVSDPEVDRFEAIKKRNIIGLESYLKSNPEQEPSDVVQIIRATGIVQPRDVYLQALYAVASEDVAQYVKKYYATGPVSVVYEGKINSDFPDHTALLAMRPASEPIRDVRTDRRLTGVSPQGKDLKA